MNFWEAQLAVTCGMVFSLAVWAYGVYQKEDNKQGLALGNTVGSIAMSILLLLALWCIWSPYTYRFATKQ
jgi:hypothetical protein